eukprot:TRINITY_DN47059_c0_g1_i1.p1 TRINITY_DN47059_c0_g1~~TRINITY_DN47059_c0_g1_i1.p1  ORF type:complete len:315 (-),score=70.31 TRINITY_DN47059_c0_g1_i1:15-881(-)
MDFRVRGPKGQATLRGVAADASLDTFLGQIADGTGVPKPCIQLSAGFPPKPLELPQDLTAAVSSLGLRSGESLIVREVEPQGAGGVLVRRVVDSDNSCLFTSVGYVALGGRTHAPELRQVAADKIAADPDRYSEAFLAKSNPEYCQWIKKMESWGGAIELSVFSEHFQCEIAAYDLCTTRRDLYGEGMGYKKRCMLIYDGIHYDALAVAPKADGGEGEDATMFDVGGVADIVDAKAAAFVAEQHKLRNFTDTGNFTLRCLVCQKGVKGEKEAELHAKETGHQNFAEFK